MAICLVALTAITARAQDWKPITPAELAQKASTVEKDADSEIIFEEVRVDDRVGDELSVKHYLRIKIFTDRGREENSKIDISGDLGGKIRDVTARVIKSDGSIVEIKKEDIFERTIAKAGGEKVKARGFAVTGIEPGVIIEYRFREVVSVSILSLTLPFQRVMPVQSLTYLIRPFPGQLGMRAQQFKIPSEVKFEKDKDGYFKATMTNIAGFHVEPRMPPINQVRSWVMVYYTDEKKDVTPQDYWKEFNTRVYGRVKDLTKPNDDVKRVAAEITVGAATSDEKIAKIFEYVKTQINNVSFDPNMTQDEKDKLKENNSPGDTLKRKVGTVQDIDLLFGALVRGAGMEAYLTYTGDRSELFVNQGDANSRLFHYACIAVKVGDGWKFFNPGLKFMPYGMLIWYEEGQDALIVNPKDVIWSKTPMSMQEKNQEKRTGKFKLLEDGTLEGHVRIEFTGQYAYSRKRFDYDDSITQQESTLRGNFKEQMSTAEFADIKIENVNDPEKPFVYTFNVRVPGYAQRTGKRLFLQPGFFEHGSKALFTAKERKHDVYFHYPWSEEDDITIELPAGFALDSADAPAPITPQMTQEICGLSIKMGVSADKKLLVYKRSFFFGGKGNVIFPVASYAAVKNLFDLIRTADDHSLALRQQ
ncbi:MAG: DUF3857 and transglutaminase domain-containing protein [Pyrinomonadaceae bacterium]